MQLYIGAEFINASTLSRNSGLDVLAQSIAGTGSNSVLSWSTKISIQCLTTQSKAEMPGIPHCNIVNGLEDFGRQEC